MPEKTLSLADLALENDKLVLDDPEVIAKIKEQLSTTTPQGPGVNSNLNTNIGGGGRVEMPSITISW